MKKFLLLLFVLLVILSCQTGVFAENVSIPKEMLTDAQKLELEKQNVKEKIESTAGWIGLGKEIGSAVDSSLSALTERADQFANTKVGIFTMCIVAYKVVGNDFIQILIGVPLLLFMLLLWTVSFYKNCIPHKVTVSVEGPFWSRKKTYEQIGVDDTEYGMQRWAYGAVLIAIIGVAATVIFA